jgi:methylated-DNA-[protein]-cysteine S-methyltransferase
MPAQSFSLFDTPLGPCAIAWSSNGITGVQLPESDGQSLQARVRRRFPGAVDASPPAAILRAIARIQAMLTRKAGATDDTLSDLTLDLEGVPEFHRKVYELVRTVLPGQTITYGEIAKRLGVPHDSREVGQAMGRNPVPIIVPCHRVLGADGRMGGFSAPGGIVTKRRMLEIEGAAAVGAGPLFDR